MQDGGLRVMGLYFDNIEDARQHFRSDMAPLYALDNEAKQA